MSKGIGWDIGIKNLAYCSLESNVSINSNNINSLFTTLCVVYVSL